MGMINTSLGTRVVDLPSPTAVFERLNEVLPAVKEANMYAICTAWRIRPSNGGVRHASASRQPCSYRLTGNTCRLEDQQLPRGLLSRPPYCGNE